MSVINEVLPVIWPTPPAPRANVDSGFVSDDTVRAHEGILAGYDLRLRSEVDAAGRRFHLFRNEVLLGSCAFALNRRAREAELYDLRIEFDWRRQGLGLLLVRAGLRHLVVNAEAACFSLRMLQLFRSEGGALRLHQVGLGVIARSLGLAPSYNLTRLLSPANVECVILVLNDDGRPPCYRIVLRSYPLVMVAVLAVPDPGEPFAPRHMVYGARVNRETVASWADDPHVIFGNCDYILRRPGIPTLLAAITRSPAEARMYYGKIMTNS